MQGDELMAVSGPLGYHYFLPNAKQLLSPLAPQSS